MARGYSSIYQRLVEDRTDIVGHIAYSLYKADKVEFVNHFKAKNNREPDEHELQPFHDSSCLDGALMRYRESAISILAVFLDNTLSETVRQLEHEVQSQYQENIKEATKELQPISKKRRYGEGIVQSILGALMFALLVAAIAFIIQFKGTELPINASPNNADPEVVAPIEHQP